MSFEEATMPTGQLKFREKSMNAISGNEKQGQSVK